MDQDVWIKVGVTLLTGLMLFGRRIERWWKRRQLWTRGVE